MPRYGQLLTLAVIVEGGLCHCGHTLAAGDLAMANPDEYEAKLYCLPCAVDTIKQAIEDVDPHTMRKVGKGRIAEILLALRSLNVTARPKTPAPSEETL